MHEGGENCLKYLIRGWNRIEGRENKDFKKERVSCVKGWVPQKKGGGLQSSYELWCKKILRKCLKAIKNMEILDRFFRVLLVVQRRLISWFPMICVKNAQ